MSVVRFLKRFLRAWAGEGSLADPPPRDPLVTTEDVVEQHRAPPKYVEQHTGEEIRPPDKP